MRRKRYKLKKVFYIPIIIILLAIIISITTKIHKHKKIENKVKDVLIETKNNIDKNSDELLKKAKELKSINNDFVGILTIPDTIINYPVMYTKGEDYYLRRSFDKKQSNAGTLYIDKYNNIDPRDDNLIIYGHNMNDGTMFHELLNYKKEEFYKEHKYIYFTTDKEYEKYVVVASFLSKVYYKTDQVFKYYKFYNANNEDEFNNYVKNIKKLSLYETNTKLNYKDKFITLSTCEYSQENGRFAVVLKKIVED